MRARLGSLTFGTMVAAVLALSGCKPTYPKCSGDDDCKEKGEVCINGQCQECRDNAQCDAKYGPGRTCVDGRCEAKAAVPECTTNDDCPSGKRCEASKCVEGCMSDQQCGAGQTCVNGVCQSASTKVSAACQPMNPKPGEVIALEMVRFGFDRYDLTPEARSTLDQDAECLKQAPGVRLMIEGHCDERGTQEYNLALGDRRANAVKGYLKNLGIDAARMDTRSKGKNEPLCREQSEECWGKNRRAEFIQKVANP